MLGSIKLPVVRFESVQKRAGLSFNHHEMDDEFYQRVLKFWFPPQVSLDTCHKTLWFVRSNTPQQFELDETIRYHFSDLLQQALGEDASWRAHHCKTLDGHVALIILLDQFSRHIYRQNAEEDRSKKMAHVDRLAFQLACDLIDSNRHRELTYPLLCLLP